jgi:hypothetical protein
VNDFDKKSFILVHDMARQRAIEYVRLVPDGWSVLVRPPMKTRDQEEKYHSMLEDIAKQCQHLNMALDRETWKRLAIDQFRRETLKDPPCCAEYWARNQLSVIPSLDGSAVVVMGEQSRKFPRKVASVFIEWLYSFGANRNVNWRDSSERGAA